MASEYSLDTATINSRITIRQTYYSLLDQNRDPDKYYWVEGLDDVRYTEQEAIELLGFYKDLVYYKKNNTIQLPSILFRLPEFKFEEDESHITTVRRILFEFLTATNPDQEDWKLTLESAFGEEYMDDKFIRVLGFTF